MKRRFFIEKLASGIFTASAVPMLLLPRKASGQAVTVNGSLTVGAGVTSIAPGIGGGGGGGSTCQIGAQNTSQTDSAEFGDNNANFYTGQIWSNDQPSRTICEVDFLIITKSGGNTSGKTLTGRIWTSDGTVLSSNVATSSNTQTYNNTGAYGWVTFTFANYVLSANTYYGFTIDAGGNDLTNYFNMGLLSGASGVPGHGDNWTNTGSLNTSWTSYGANIKIYWLQ